MTERKTDEELARLGDQEALPSETYRRAKLSIWEIAVVNATYANKVAGIPNPPRSEAIDLLMDLANSMPQFAKVEMLEGLAEVLRPDVRNYETMCKVLRPVYYLRHERLRDACLWLGGAQG